VQHCQTGPARFASRDRGEQAPGLSLLTRTGALICLLPTAQLRLSKRLSPASPSPAPPRALGRPFCVCASQPRHRPRSSSAHSGRSRTPSGSGCQPAQPSCCSGRRQCPADARGRHQRAARAVTPRRDACAARASAEYGRMAAWLRGLRQPRATQRRLARGLGVQPGAARCSLAHSPCPPRQASSSDCLGAQAGGSRRRAGQTEKRNAVA